MKKLALLIVAAVPSILFVMGADCSNSNVTPCTADADCAADAAAPVCDTALGQCVPAECTEDVQCQATDAGATATCASDSDCTGTDKCLEGDTGNSHCVTPKAAGDDCAAIGTEGGFTGVDASEDGTTFCADGGVSCGADHKCSGGQFG